MIELYHHGSSACAAKVRFALEEKHLKWTGHYVDILAGEHPIIPVMVGEARLAARMAEVMLEKGVYVVSFSYPVVPQGKARIRTQVSAAHSREDLERAVRAFVETREEIGQ